MSGYSDPSAVFLAGDGGVKVDPNDPAFSTTPPAVGDQSLPAIYLFSNSRNGDGVAFAMAEDGTVLGSHWCSHWGYMRHDLHDRADRRAADPEALVARAIEIEDEHHAWERNRSVVTLVSIVAPIQAALVEVGLPTDAVHVSVAMGRRPSVSMHHGEPGRRYTREEAERLGRALGLTDAEWTGQGEPEARIETRQGHTPDGVRVDIHCEAGATP